MDAGDLSSDQRSGLIAAIRARVGADVYDKTVDSVGEDAVLNAVLNQQSGSSSSSTSSSDDSPSFFVVLLVIGILCLVGYGIYWIGAGVFGYAGYLMGKF